MGNLVSTLGKLAEDRLAVENTSDPAEKADRARDLLAGMMYFAQTFVGDEVLRAAYGEVKAGDREEALRVSANRLLVADLLFARMPRDDASLFRVAEEAIAVANGDAPTFFARLSGSNVRKVRVHRAKFSAFVWDAYLEALGIDKATREYRIWEAYGTSSDSRRKWLKPARAILGEEYVDYHLRKASGEGRRAEPYTFTQSYYDAKVAAPMTWQEALHRDGKRFKAIQRESKATEEA